MADFSSLKQTIRAYIKQNGNEEITGNILQDVLLAMVSTMGDSAINGLASALQDELNARQNADGLLQGNITAEATERRSADTALGGRIDGLQTVINGINTKLAEGYIYVGIATPSTNPGIPSGKVFYFAVQAGTYTNFNGISVTEGITILKYNGTMWIEEQLQFIDVFIKDTISDNEDDFYIADENNKAVVKFSGGEISTKNFNTKETPKTTISAEADLDIADENGKVIVRFVNGDVKTKNFDSSSIIIYKKPYTSVWERFIVKINRTPVGKFYSGHEDATDSADAAADEKDVTGVIALPSSYTPTGEPTKLICFCHGTTGNVTQNQWYNNNPLMIEHFVPFWLSKGYAVFDCNGVADGMDRYSGNSSAPCGLPDTMQAYIKCYDYLVTNYNFYPKVYIWGCSDGGPVPLNWAFMRPGTIAAIADCDPVIDLKQDAWDGSFNNLNLRRQNIAERLGFANTTSGVYENDRADIWNPFAKIIEISNKKYAFGFNVPILIACTASGSYFSSSTFHIREEFAEALINGGTICKSKWYETLSHDDVAMGGDNIVLNDVLKWFNRF